MSKYINRRVASLMAAGMVLFTASGCKGTFSPDRIFNSILEQEEKKDKTPEEEYEEKREEFRKKYLLEDYTGGSFGPLNYFGIPRSAYEETGEHSPFDETELYLGNNFLSFDFLQSSYEQGKASQFGRRFSTDWLDISADPDGKHRYHTMSIDKGLVFPISDTEDGMCGAPTEDVVMYSMCGASSVDISIEKRVDGVTEFIRVLNFTIDENDKLVLSSDRITRLYRDDMGTRFMTIETFDLVNRELEDGSKVKVWRNSSDISFSFEGGQYSIWGPLNTSEGGYEIVSNYDAENGLGQYENTYAFVDEACFEDIRLTLMGGDFGLTAEYFQSAIKEASQEPKILEKEYE